MDYSKIKDISRIKKISIKELASRVGVSQTGLHHSIKTQVMRIDVIEKIAKTLDVNVCVFFEDVAHKSNDTMELNKNIKLFVNFQHE